MKMKMIIVLLLLGFTSCFVSGGVHVNGDDGGTKCRLKRITKCKLRGSAEHDCAKQNLMHNLCLLVTDNTSCQINSKEQTMTLLQMPLYQIQLINFMSYHPVGQKKSIPYSQMLRVKRIVSDHMRLDTRLHTLSTKFRDKGYTRRVLQQAQLKTSGVTREELLRDVPKKKMDRLPFLDCWNFTKTEEKNVRAALKKRVVGGFLEKILEPGGLLKLVSSADDDFLLGIGRLGL